MEFVSDIGRRFGLAVQRVTQSPGRGTDAGGVNVPKGSLVYSAGSTVFLARYSLLFDE